VTYLEVAAPTPLLAPVTGATIRGRVHHSGCPGPLCAGSRRSATHTRVNPASAHVLVTNVTVRMREISLPLVGANRRDRRMSTLEPVRMGIELSKVAEIVAPSPSEPQPVTECRPCSRGSSLRLC
jgi:hypothetical protein